MSTKGFASSFADLADVRAFKRAKAKGMTDQEAFRYGDNGIGCFGDDVTTLKIPYVAVPPDDMVERWGSVKAAKHKPVLVTINGVTHRCIVGDRMPWRKNIRNKAVIDLAPGAQAAFGLKPPFMVPASWVWA
jgi:hypothetical protein